MPQSRASTLSELAVALERPALALAELAWGQLARELVAQHESLIGAQLLGGTRQQAQLATMLNELLDVGSHIRRLDTFSFDVCERQGG